MADAIDIYGTAFKNGSATLLRAWSARAARMSSKPT